MKNLTTGVLVYFIIVLYVIGTGFFPLLYINKSWGLWSLLYALNWIPNVLLLFGGIIVFIINENNNMWYNKRPLKNIFY